MDDGHHCDASIPVTVVSSHSGFLLASLPLVWVLIFLLVHFLLVPIHLNQEFCLSLAFLPIWLIVVIMAFILPMRSIRLTLKLVRYIRKRLLLGVGLVINSLEQISSSFLSPDHFCILITSLCLPRYPTTLICSSG